MANPVGASFCARCAERLTPTAQTQAAPGTQVGPQKWYDRQPRSFNAVDKQGIDRTQTGLLLLIIGLLLGPIPYLNFIGGILDIVGAIMVILGRDTFGVRHGKLVIISLVVYLVGLAITFVNAFALVFSIVQASLVGGTSSAVGQAFSQAFNQFLIGSIVGGAVQGIAVVLLTYALQTSRGKMLLWTGFITNMVIGVLVFVFVSQEVSSVVREAASGSSSSTLSLIQSLQSLQGQIQLIGLLAFIPAIINAVAYNMVRSRISKGELPEPANPVAPVFSGANVGSPAVK